MTVPDNHDNTTEMTKSGDILRSATHSPRTVTDVIYPAVLSLIFSLFAPDVNASDLAYFGCPVSGVDTCYFRISNELGSKGTDRIISVRGYSVVTVPGLAFDRDMYCMEVGQIPPESCHRKTVNRNFNR
jgi:hypothetical protein